jgi:CHAT domain-containing protein/tetratricopeptide (TPR) repeat protein
MHQATIRSSSTARVRLALLKTWVALGAITWIAFVIASPPAFPAEDNTDPTPTGGLTQSIDLNVQSDPRGDLQIQGPVEWEPGKLTLGPAASIRRALGVGAQAKLALRLAFTPFNEDGQTSTTRFFFQIRDRGEFVVVIVRRREAGKTRAQIQLIEENTPDPGEQPPTHTRVLYTSAWRDDLPDAVWTFRHHYGLEIVSAGAERLAIGYSDKEPRGQFWKHTPTTDRLFFENCAVHEPLEVSGWGLEQSGLAVSCLEVSGLASASYRNASARSLGAHNNAADLSFDLRQRLKFPFYGIQARLSQGDGRDIRRVESYDASLRAINRLLGQRHPNYALALAGTGMQYHWFGEEASAEQLLRRALAISKESLGSPHPDHTLIVSALGRFYVDTGRYDRAEPFLTEALASTRELFGALSDRTAVPLRELAMCLRETGRSGEAETLLRQAVEVGKAAPLEAQAETLLALGLLESRLGEREKASALLTEAQTLVDREAERLWKQTTKAEVLAPVLVSQARIQTQRGWILLGNGQHQEARKLARSAFLMMCEPKRAMTGSRTQFAGWNSEMSNFQPHPSLVRDPAYGRTMMALAELFLALRDHHPAYGCIQVLDLVPGQSRHDLAVVYRLMSKVNEIHPRSQATAFVDPSIQPERWRLEMVYYNKARRQDPKPDDRLPAPVDYWLQLARQEFEKFSGRDHPDTLDALLTQARRQWRSDGPAKAESTLHDAWARAVDLSDKVLPGLPEAQAYQFLEANRPPVDLMLSLYRATKQDHARDAYEVVWRSKSLATRQMAERRQIVQATSGRPDTARLADELQHTRQQLARVCLFVPRGNAIEQRSRQLADLTRRKEDLERELARLSEPFRRARDAESSRAADLVQRLPAGTVIVDFAERWEWTPPPLEKGELEQERPAVGPGRSPGMAPPQAGFDPGELAREALRRGGSLAVLPPQPGTDPLKRRNGQTPPQPTGRPPSAPQRKGTAAQRKKAADQRNVAAATPPAPARPAPAARIPAKIWVKNRCYDAFVLQPDKGEPGWSVKWLELGDADALDRLLDNWIATLRPGGRADHDLARRLRDRLWKPIEAALGDCQTVIVIPDGRLAQVPWNALPGRRPDSYVIEDYALAQAPYGQYVARLLNEPARAGDGFLLVGAIDYGPAGKWPFLNGTAVEVEQLARLRPRPDTVRVVGASATQSHLRELMPGRRFIHLATHGEFLDSGSKRDDGRFLVADSSSGGALFDVTARNPLVLSKLVLAGANRRVETDSAGLPIGDDGFLTAEEVMGMDLSRNELVVLSACETGAGKVRGSEGVFSLQRAFHVAGARAVVASLWAVDDRATQTLMGRFYQNLWSNEGKSKGKLEALREAQLWLLRHGATELGRMRGGLERPNSEPMGTLSPSYWAAFILSGDWR